ncbi:MAG: DNA primase [Lachnospiraceae bacterium]|nr:DNA primase [Lachnospiraceae bacterium]
MYYPEELVEEIRSKNDIVDVIGSYLHLTKKGSSHMACCPFHNEKTPSFSVSSSKQMFYCFGCGKGGNVFTFLMEYENLTFLEALQMLADRAHVELPQMEYSEEAKRAAQFKARLYAANKEAAKYYFYQLKSARGKLAMQYLKKRALTDRIISCFGLGYSNKYSDDLYKYLKNLGFEDELLRQSGLVTLDEACGGSDKFWNRVMFPIMDVNSRVIAFGGRVMGEGEPKYLNSPETPIFEKSRNLYGLNFARSSRMNYFLLCEGYMDVLSLHQAGYTNAVASLGTSLTTQHARILARYVKEVVLTYDSDGAGVKAALRAIPLLKEAGILTRVVDMRPYKDPDEFIRALGSEEYQKRINGAQNSFFYEIDVLQKDYDLADPEQKTRFYNEMAKRLLNFSEELERNNYTEALAEKYCISYESLRKLVNRYGAQGESVRVAVGSVERQREDAKKKGKPKEGMKRSQRLLLTRLIEEPDAFARIKGIIGPEDFTEEFYHHVAGMVFEEYKEYGSVNPAKLIGRFEDAGQQQQAAELFSTKLDAPMDEQGRKKEFADTVVRVKQNSLDVQYALAVGQNDFAALQRIMEERRELGKLHSSLNLG